MSRMLLGSDGRLGEFRMMRSCWRWSMYDV